MSRFQHSMIVFYIGMAVVVFAGYLAIRACGGGSETMITPAVVATRYPAVLNQAKDTEVQSNARMLYQGIEIHRAQYGSYPQQSQVAPGGQLAEILPDWPDNPFTQQPMESGTDPGDYTYDVDPNGTSFTLKVYLSNGAPLVQP